MDRARRRVTNQGQSRQRLGMNGGDRPARYCLCANRGDGLTIHMITYKFTTSHNQEASRPNLSSEVTHSPNGNPRSHVPSPVKFTDQDEPIIGLYAESSH
ncbi:hypothetical protein J6590_107353 [Homalodisca vitripennis]|nr:hypothetical protein J6590_107353 [Homalodisca vitripennis]